MHRRMKPIFTLECIKFLSVFFVVWDTNKSFAFDITVPFDLTLRLALEKGPSGYEYPGVLVGEARGDLRELPARLDVGEDGQPYWYGRYVSPCCRRWEADGWAKLNDGQATKTRPLLDSSYRHGGKPLAGVWALQKEEGTLTSPTLHARFPDIRGDNVTDLVCMKILAKVPEGARISVVAETTDRSGAMEIGEIIGTTEYEWTLTKLTKVKSHVTQGHDVRIKLLGKQLKDSINKALVQWTTFCADELELHDYYSVTYMKKNSTQAHYSLLVPPGKYGTVSSRVCLNGGKLDLDLGVCQCVPGFTGAVCERSCGPNSYGVHCTALCSSPRSDRECRGIFSCSGQGCRCFSGLQGDTCDEPCPPGYYGSNCEMKCGSCAEDLVCDRYSGWCPRGCSGGQQSPLCHEECGRTYDGSNSPIERGDFFWNVGIYEKKNTTYTKKCGASLVKPAYLLTAAWCFFSEEEMALKPASEFVALFGTNHVHCFSDNAFPTGIETRRIILIKVPPLYRGSRNSYVDDIALVQLERPVVPGPGIAPLCHEPLKRDASEIPNESVGFVAGWNLFGNDCNSTLNGYHTEYIHHTRCLGEIPDVAVNDTDTTKFCARARFGSNGTNQAHQAEDAYIGSGFIYDSRGDLYIYGVKSGANNNKNITISVYTKVSDYIEWITSTWNRLDIKQAVKENTVDVDNEHEQTDETVVCSS